jgi:serine/threonine protein phosphatase PrpC
MPYQVELEFAAKTDTGLVRAHNEDAIAISTECGFAILADGMGGYNAGEVASGIATSVLKETLEQRLRNQQWDMRLNRSKRIQQMLVESIAHANDSIFEAARINPNNSGMGTTLVAALFHQDRVTIAHIGDSRAYRLRKGELVQITHDHSMLQEQIDAGLISEENAQFAQNRNLITRAMGVDYDLDVEVHEHETEEGDIYILCSDGLSDMLSKEQILDILNSAGTNLDSTCDELIRQSNEHGGRDNISIVLVAVQSKDTASPGLVGRVMNWLR